MRVVLISDVHANYQALQGVLEEIADLDYDRIVCLGDVVGYYSQPQECVDMIRKLGCLCIQGNHDAVASGREEPDSFNPVAMDAIYWTREQLDAGSRAWLGSLPVKAEIAPGVFGVHGSWRNRDEYLLTQRSVEANFESMTGAEAPFTVFFGHTHRRAVYCHLGSGMSVVTFGDNLSLSASNLYLINPGGTGQPRDGVPGAPYAILEDGVVHFRRAKYDVEEAAARVAALPFGDLLAERLFRGI